MANDLKTEAVNLFLHFCELYFSRDINSHDALLQLMAKNVNGFGTAFNENFSSLEDWKEQIKREVHQIPNAPEFEFFNITPFCFDNVVTIAAQFNIKLNYFGKEVHIDNIRISSVIRKAENKLEIIQVHFSEPDNSMEGEVAPGSQGPQMYKNASVVFTDFVGFTKMTSEISPNKLISELNRIFAQFDEIIRENGLTKIKTIGDAYMAVSGLKEEENNADKCVKASLEIIDFLKQKNTSSDLTWDIRVGIHVGDVIGGVIGSNKMAFDLWGDTVNIASRIEGAGLVNKVNLSLEAYNHVKSIYPCLFNGTMALKGKGNRDLYYVA